MLERLTLLDYLYLPDDNKYFLESIDNRIRLLEYDLESMIDHWNKLKKNVRENIDSIYMIAQLTTVRMQAQSNLLSYFYDSNDGWNVEITCKEVYHLRKKADRREPNYRPPLFDTNFRDF